MRKLMRSKIFLSSLGAIAATVGGLTLTSPSAFANSAEPTTTAAEPVASWIDAGGQDQYITGRREDGMLIEIYHKTTFRMICWWDEFPGGPRKFYGEFTSGRYDGQYGDMVAGAVRNQTKVPHCD